MRALRGGGQTHKCAAGVPSLLRVIFIRTVVVNPPNLPTPASTHPPKQPQWLQQKSSSAAPSKQPSRDVHADALTEHLRVSHCFALAATRLLFVFVSVFFFKLRCGRKTARSVNHVTHTSLPQPWRWLWCVSAPCCNRALSKQPGFTTGARGDVQNPATFFFSFTCKNFVSSITV